MDVDRRRLIGAGLAAPAILGFGARAAWAAADTPFTLGIASGEPWPDSVVLWTRLAPRPLEGDGGMRAAPVAVRWELAEDDRFARIVRHGTARAAAKDGHSVHVEVAGLNPGRVYHYRFIAGGVASPTGRTRTAPARDAAVERLRLCFASCQNYEVGHYAAYRHMVADDPDLILFLGDYIYEGKPEKRVRAHLNPEPVDLAGYRVRYATYKSDPLLQAAHQAAPWATIWDDHEVANDYADTLDENNGDPVAFLRRRAAAYRAFWEHMPLRASARPDGPAMRLYRTLDWGRLAQIQLIDDRQYRGPRACQPAGLVERRQPYLKLIPDCPERIAPERTMLGQRQEAWLDSALGHSPAQWNLLAQQTLMTSLRRVDPAHDDQPAHLYSADTWASYPAARDRIIRRWADARTSNPIALGGDIHAFAAGDMRHPDRPDGPPVASEFVGGSITSLFHDPFLKAEAKVSGLAFAENEVHGFGRVDLTGTGANIVFRGLRDATTPDSPVYDLARFAIEPGTAGLHTL
jgi:alkaline phosphatase D